MQNFLLTTGGKYGIMVGPVAYDKSAPWAEFLSIVIMHKFLLLLLCNIPILQFSRNDGIISINKGRRNLKGEINYEKYI